MAIWRIQTNTDGRDISNIAQYCINNNVAAVGWSLLKHTNRSELDNLSFEDYCEIAKLYYDSIGSVERLAHDVKPNDLIWMRKEGIYYLARVEEDSRWFFNSCTEATQYDACNQINHIHWIKIGDESSIPGALSTSFIRGAALQRIYKPGVLEYSELIYDRKSTDNYKYNRTIELNEANFYALISPTDCEDLLYIYTYKQSGYRYVCIPSTNKISTPKYEFVAMDATTGGHIYYQAKNGEILINADDYCDLVESPNAKVYLLSTRGKVIRAEKYDRIYVVDPTNLFEFACDEENAKIIPPNIKYWMEFAGGYSNS